MNHFLFCWAFLLLLSKGYFTHLYFAVHLAIISHWQTLQGTLQRLQGTKELQFVKMIILCNVCGKKFSPFPLAMALKKGDTNLPETSSGCIVIPSLTAWYPFSMITGAHPNHKVNMLPWIFASCRWERSQESTDEIPHVANKDEPAFILITGPALGWNGVLHLPHKTEIICKKHKCLFQHSLLETTE